MVAYWTASILKSGAQNIFKTDALCESVEGEDEYVL